MAELILPAASQPAFIQTIDPRLMTAGAAIGANVTIYMWMGMVNRPLTVANAYVYPTVQNGNLDVAVGTFDGTTFTRLQSTGSTAVGVVNTVQAIPFAFTFQPGIEYWAAIETDSATAAFWRFNGTGTPNNWYPLTKAKTTATFPIPATDTPATADGAMFWIGFK